MRNEMRSLYDLMATPTRGEGKQSKCSGSGQERDPYCASFVLVCWFVFAFTLTSSLPNVYSHSIRAMLSAWQETKAERSPCRGLPGSKITIVNVPETNKQTNK